MRIVGKLSLVLLGIIALGVLIVLYPKVIGSVLITGALLIATYVITQVFYRRKSIFRANYYYKNRKRFMENCKKNKEHIIDFPKEIEGYKIVKKFFPASKNVMKFYPEIDEMKLMWNGKIFDKEEEVQDPHLSIVFDKETKEKELKRITEELKKRREKK